jgi:hypothetical protein
MQPIQATTSITVDGETYTVSSMSNEVKQMVQYLDDWRQDEVDQASQLLKTRAGLKDLQNTLLQQIQKENAEAAEAAIESGDIGYESEEA